jgi:hypothetical protein
MGRDRIRAGGGVRWIRGTLEGSGVKEARIESKDRTERVWDRGVSLSGTNSSCMGTEL